MVSLGRFSEHSFEEHCRKAASQSKNELSAYHLYFDYRACDTCAPSINSTQAGGVALHSCLDRKNERSKSLYIIAMGDHSINGTSLTEKAATSNSSTTKLSNGRLKDEYYKPVPPDNFAPRPGDQILNIGIVGAGIAGLAAASALVQSGHNVEVRRIPVLSSLSYFS